jgi:hypothetical protein
MYKKIITILFSLLLFGSTIAYAQSYQKTGTSVAIVNATVTTAAVLVPYDPTNVGWSICAETGAARCAPGTQSGGAASPTPTTTVGYYIASGTCQPIPPTTNPILEVDCAAASGSITMSAWISHK